MTKSKTPLRKPKNSCKNIKTEKRECNLVSYTAYINDFFKNKVDIKDRQKEVSRMHKKFLALQDREYYLIGYGSLINKRSRETTFAGKESFHATINGWSRVFNIESRSYSGRSVLNVFPSDKSINVVITKLSGEEMQDVLLREWQYDLQEVELENVLDDEGKSIELESKPIMVVGRPDRAFSVEVPVLSYVQTCINGCDAVNDTMANTFVESTYLSDKTTTLKSWLENLDLIKHFSDWDSSY